MNDVYEQMRPVTLTFRDPAAEAHFRSATLPLLRWHGRVATLVGVLVYLMFGVLDPYYIPAELHADVWTIRGLGIVVTLLLMSLSWTRWYETLGSWCLMLTGATAGLGLLGIFWILPPNALEYYYAGLILLSFYTFNFSGTRFVLALGCNVMLLVVYNVLFVYLQERPRDVWLSHNLHLFSAGILGGTAATWPSTASVSCSWCAATSRVTAARRAMRPCTIHSRVCPIGCCCSIACPMR